MMKRLCACTPVLLPLLFILSGCIESELEDDSVAAGSTMVSTAFFDDEGAAVQVLDARNSNTWVYFDLDTFSAVVPEDPANEARWDIAFRRFVVKLNGGVSGAGGVDAAAMHDRALIEVTDAPTDGFNTDRALDELSDAELLQLGSNIFFAVCEKGFDDADDLNTFCLANGRVDRAHLNPDEFAYAFLTRGSGQVVPEREGEEAESILGWYDYYPHENHILRPSGDIWVINTSAGNQIALEMLGYYGYREGDAESGTVAFRFVSLTPGFDIPLPGAQQLQASIQTTNTVVPAQSVIQFQGAAQDVVGEAGWHWDFGDGTEAVGQTVSHVYTKTGNNTVRLTVTDARGAESAASVSLVMTVIDSGFQPPLANAGEDQSIELLPGETERAVILDASGSTDPDGNADIALYTWTGTPDPDDMIKPQLLLGQGSYEFSLAVRDLAGNTDSDTVRVVVSSPENVPPIAVIDAATLSGPAPLPVEFSALASSDSDGTIGTYIWDFGDGSPSESGAEPSHQFNEPGAYVVSLSVIDDAGAVGGASVIVQSNLVARAVQDTYHYEFLGNQDEPDGSGDSGNISIFNHASNHGGKALLEVDDAFLSAPALSAGPGSYQARLWLYAVCEPGGFVVACPGDAGASGVRTDVLMQASGWEEGDAGLSWDDISETSPVSATLTQSTSSGWLSVDVTGLVDAWRAGTPYHGFALSQEAYAVVRADNGGLAVSQFCDSESSSGLCSTGDFKPYLEITVLP
jgi:PKD repeat protein